MTELSDRWRKSIEIILFDIIINNTGARARGNTV